jgi:hypothetical protein
LDEVKQRNGILCSHLCKKENKFEILKDYKLIDCYSFESSSENIHFRNAFKSVFVYELQSENAKEKSGDSSDLTQPKRMVLKSRNRYYFDFGSNLDFDFNTKSVIDQLKLLAANFESTLNTKFGIQIDSNVSKWLENYSQNPKSVLDTMHKNFHVKDLIYYVKLFSVGNLDVFLDALRKEDKESLGNYISNLLLLMSQDEYLFYRFFQAKPGALKIDGTCGHFYFVEYAEPLTYKVRNMSNANRKRLATQFLELAHQLDTIYLVNERRVGDFGSAKNATKSTAAIPIQMCDMKLDNFGVSERGELKLIDTDMVSTDVYFFNEKVCTAHEDCHYFDCKSYCDPVTKKCLGSRVNNNLQSLCEKILNNTWLRADGVLSGMTEISSNVKHEMNRRLEKCENPGFFMSTNISKGADPGLYNIFRVLLNDRGILQV